MLTDDVDQELGAYEGSRVDYSWPNGFPCELLSCLAIFDIASQLVDEVRRGKHKDRLKQTESHLQGDVTCERSESCLEECILVVCLSVALVVSLDALQVSLH